MKEPISSWKTAKSWMIALFYEKKNMANFDGGHFSLHGYVYS